MSVSLDYQNVVESRYSDAAKSRQPALCCPVKYPGKLLQVIPDEILERDYGCGDPSPFVRKGDTVVDLGSGGGKLCYIASQLVGPDGNVIGVDCNQEMLNLARQYQPQVAGEIGYDNVSFRCGMIQDLRLDLEVLARRLQHDRAPSVAAILKQRQIEQILRDEKPMIRSDSVDCVVSNCVLNLVQPDDRRQLFREVFRVLKRGGRAAISDIVSDEDVPEHLRENAELWSGCISGAWKEEHFLAEFERAGFHGVNIARRETEPWKTVEGIEFRSMTVVAYKGKEGPCLDRNQAVIYRGPFSQIEDDDGHTFKRGQRTAVCNKTFQLLQREPYSDLFVAIEPFEPVSMEIAQRFDCGRSVVRHPGETKGAGYDKTMDGNSDCSSSNGKCC